MKTLIGVLLLVVTASNYQAGQGQLDKEKINNSQQTPPVKEEQPLEKSTPVERRILLNDGTQGEIAQICPLSS